MAYYNYIMKHITRLPLFLAALLLPILSSCATAVFFDVRHPPVVDMRGVDSITVIPFEWNERGWSGDPARRRGWGGARHVSVHLSRQVTAELLSGLRGGNIPVVDPHRLYNVLPQDYWRHVDVFISGRIVGVSASDHVNSREEIRGQNTVTINEITRTVTVDIEYSYIRASNNEVLGHFRKSATAREFFEYERSRQSNRGRGASAGRPPHPPHLAHPPHWHHSNRPFSQRGNRRHDAWTDHLASVAARQFSQTMRHELGPWMTTERRTIRRRSRGENRIAEARRMVRHRYYGGAIAIYTEVFERTGSTTAAFNTAVLLQVNGQFAEALELLENARNRALASGRNIPSYMRREIQRLTVIVNGLRILRYYY